MRTVKILGVNGSPRKSATYRALEIALDAARGFGNVETAIVSLHELKVQPCTGCDWCKRNKALCRIKDDMVKLYPEITGADGFIIASPVYMMSATPQILAFLSRWRPLHHVMDGVLRNKVAAGISVGGTRNGGQETTLSILAHAMIARGLIFVGNEPGSYSGGMVWSKDIGSAGVEEDTRGIQTLHSIGRRLAEVACMVIAGEDAIRAVGA